MIDHGFRQIGCNLAELRPKVVFCAQATLQRKISSPKNTTRSERDLH